MYFTLIINFLFTWKYITCIVYDFQRYPLSNDDDEFQNELIRQNDFLIDFNESWPLKSVDNYLGVVSSIKATDQLASNVYVLHRGNRVWDENTFDDQNNYRLNKSEPIQKGVLVQIFNGEIKRTYFPFKFFLPHGLTIDPDGNFWITDVALHQVSLRKAN
ncbi:putative peptidyl-glycine alpha-amidating monooxygenase [Schistosoma mansoni]|uniref:putative peptidyl-glycine alpha-amidating monooxygenase n=1 Tax=Schistosoma mansoni TaxID=6183 RepID=UPI00022DC85D|nr:putative peptidyl-glycine alpha-amidating monooxygenase [Schistosoma mansoni]|eukprot:XP_018653543.1 putative peptidyl-glycine alpha-amidating monooxygenase [Schistosoma mansoni]